MKITPLFLGFVLLFTSCEYGYDYSYRVTNMTDTLINVYAKTFLIDSTFIIPKDSTKVLLVTNHGIEGSRGPYFSDVNVDLDIFIIKKNDIITSKRDYLKNDAWSFNDNDGVYSTIVTNEEFK